MLCANRLLAWDAAVSFRKLRSIVPQEGVSKPALMQGAADQAMVDLKLLLEEKAINIEGERVIFQADVGNALR